MCEDRCRSGWSLTFTSGSLNSLRWISTSKDTWSVLSDRITCHHTDHDDVLLSYKNCTFLLQNQIFRTCLMYSVCRPAGSWQQRARSWEDRRSPVCSLRSLWGQRSPGWGRRALRAPGRRSWPPSSTPWSLCWRWRRSLFVPSAEESCSTLNRTPVDTSTASTVSKDCCRCQSTLKHTHTHTVHLKTHPHPHSPP